MLTPIQMREARLAGGFKLREVAAAAKLDPSTVCFYEAGRLRPSPASLTRWRDGLRQLLEQRQLAISNALHNN